MARSAGNLQVPSEFDGASGSFAAREVARELQRIMTRREPPAR